MITSSSNNHKRPCLIPRDVLYWYPTRPLILWEGTKQMKLKQWAKYLIYIVVIYFALVLRSHLLELQKLYVGQTYRFTDFQPMMYLLAATVIVMLIGALLGLDQFLAQRKKVGKWRVNWPKLILLGVPSLVLSLYLFVFFTPFINALMPLYAWVTTYNYDFMAIFQLILGYVIITSFYREDPSIQEVP